MSETGRRLPMTEGEICEMYRTAAKKAKQIGILAQLNNTSKEEIADILTAGGYKVDGRAVRYLKREKETDCHGPRAALAMTEGGEAASTHTHTHTHTRRRRRRRDRSRRAVCCWLSRRSPRRALC